MNIWQIIFLIVMAIGVIFVLVMVKEYHKSICKINKVKEDDLKTINTPLVQRIENKLIIRLPWDENIDFSTVYILRGTTSYGQVFTNVLDKNKEIKMILSKEEKEKIIKYRYAFSFSRRCENR